jgi:hypothetical protein
MNIRIKIDTSAYDRFLANAEQNLPLSAGGANYTGMLAASDVYMQAMRDRFASASDEDGTWQELAPSTVQQHKKVGDSPPHILHLTGELEESLQRSGPGHVLEVTGNSIIEGTENEKAHWHQNGGTISGRPPVRQILVAPGQKTLDDMKTEMVNGIVQSLGVTI